jgi:hypothetical protein
MVEGAYVGSQIEFQSNLANSLIAMDTHHKAEETILLGILAYYSIR